MEAGVALETVVFRIKEIEKERDWLSKELARARRVVQDSHAVKDAASEAARFILGLPLELEKAPVLEKKLLLRKVVEGLLADRDRDEVVLTISRLPKIDNPILKAVRDGAVLSSVCPEPRLTTFRGAGRTPPKSGGASWRQKAAPLGLKLNPVLGT